MNKSYRSRLKFSLPVLALGLLIITMGGCSRSDDASTNGSPEIPARGTVIRRSEALQGFRNAGSTTYIQLAVRLDDDQQQPGALLVLSDSCRFLHLPLAQVGDTVLFTYELDKSGHVLLKRFEIVWAKGLNATK